LSNPIGIYRNARSISNGAIHAGVARLEQLRLRDEGDEGGKKKKKRGKKQGYTYHSHVGGGFFHSFHIVSDKDETNHFGMGRVGLKGGLEKKKTKKKKKKKKKKTRKQRTSA
jgi:hypothetical protein